MTDYKSHYSVMRDDVLNEFARDNGVYADLTFGAGGHSFALASLPGAKVLSFDQDPDALENAKKQMLENDINNVTLIDANFETFSAHAQEFLEKIGRTGFDGVVMDLGVSSHHFDAGERGFSFRMDAPLDMRMNPRAGVSAAQMLAEMREEEIADVLFGYSEEKFSRKIARAITHERKTAPIETTLQLAELIKGCYPVAQRFGKIHPATKSFQALRIAVNRELDVLSDTLPRVAQMLALEGKFAVISFHSLEDRIAKNLFKELSLRNEEPLYEASKKPLLPSPREIFENSRSRSAKMRVLKRISQKRVKNKYAHLANKE